MAITATNLAASHDTTNRTSTAYTTASISFVAGRTYMLAIRARSSGGSQAIGSISGGGNTWILLQAETISNISLWLYYCVAASTTSGAISITPDGVTTWTQAGWVVDEFSGARTVRPIVQSDSNSDAGTHTALSVVFTPFIDTSDDVGYGVFAHNEDTALTLGFGMSDLGASTEASENANRIKSGWKTGGGPGSGGALVDVSVASTAADIFGIGANIAEASTVGVITDIAEGVTDVDLYGSMHGPVWTSPTVGYVFYKPASGADPRCMKTTDAGITWAEVDAANSPTGATALDRLAIWFDQETPGDTGTVVHVGFYRSVAGAGTKTLYYYPFDTATDLWGTGVSVDTTTTTDPGTGGIAITKAVGGNLGLAATISMSGSYRFYRSTDDGATWTSKATPGEAADDIVKLYPANLADTNDIWAVYFDVSANQISLKTYDDSANSWSEDMISSAGGITESTTHPWAAFDAAVRHSDGHLLLAYWSSFDAAGSDLVTWDITDGSSMTQMTDYSTNFDDMGYVAVFINQQNDDVYIAQFGNDAGTDGAGSAWGAYYKVSTDGMSTWGSQTTYLASEDDHRGISAGHSVGSSGGWFMPVIFNQDRLRIHINDLGGVEISVPLQTITLGAKIATAESFGTPTLRANISPTAIATGESFGDHELQAGASSITPDLIASAESFGDAELLQISVISLQGFGIASEEAFGTHELQPGAASISPDAIATAESFGTHNLQAAIRPGSIISAEAFGTPYFISHISPSGIVTAEAFGTVILLRYIRPDAIGTGESFGTAELQPGTAYISPSAIATLESFGLHRLAKALAGRIPPPPGLAGDGAGLQPGVSAFRVNPPSGQSKSGLWLPPGV